jgi:hypothetical protein
VLTIGSRRQELGELLELFERQRRFLAYLDV